MEGEEEKKGREKREKRLKKKDLNDKWILLYKFCIFVLSVGRKKDPEGEGRREG